MQPTRPWGAVEHPAVSGGATQSKCVKRKPIVTCQRRAGKCATQRGCADTTGIRRCVNGIAQVEALQQALKSSESLLEASKLGQEVGVRTNLDVLNAQQQLYSTAATCIRLNITIC